VYVIAGVYMREEMNMRVEVDMREAMVRRLEVFMKEEMVMSEENRWVICRRKI
jgi:hypothetical protein